MFFMGPLRNRNAFDTMLSNRGICSAKNQNLSCEADITNSQFEFDECFSNNAENLKRIQIKKMNKK